MLIDDIWDCKYVMNVRSLAYVVAITYILFCMLLNAIDTSSTIFFILKSRVRILAKI